jgi:hypothetical protein
MEESSLSSPFSIVKTQESKSQLFSLMRFDAEKAFARHARRIFPLATFN